MPAYVRTQEGRSDEEAGGAQFRFGDSEYLGLQQDGVAIYGSEKPSLDPGHRAPCPVVIVPVAASTLSPRGPCARSKSWMSKIHVPYRSPKVSPPLRAVGDRREVQVVLDLACFSVLRLRHSYYLYNLKGSLRLVGYQVEAARPFVCLDTLHDRPTGSLCSERV